MKNRTFLISAVLVLALLAVTFWYGGDAPGLRGWSIAPDQSQDKFGSQSASGQSQDSAAPTPDGLSAQDPSAQEAGGGQSGSEDSAPVQIPDTSGAEQPDAGQPVAGAESLPPADTRPGAEGGGEAQTPAQGGASNPSGQEDEPQLCTISIRCSSVLDHLDWLDDGKEEILPADGILMPETQVEPEEGESAFSLLQRVTRAQGIHLVASFTPGAGTAYVEGIGNLYEFDCGQRSGWLYLVNGISPGYSSSEYLLQPGDRVEWVYTCDFGLDVGVSSPEAGA